MKTTIDCYYLFKNKLLCVLYTSKITVMALFVNINHKLYYISILTDSLTQLLNYTNRYKYFTLSYTRQRY